MRSLWIRTIRSAALPAFVCLAAAPPLFAEEAATLAMDIQAAAPKIYRIAIEEFRSAGYSVELAAPSGEALRVRKSPADWSFFFVQLRRKTNLWTVVTAGYRNRGSLPFWRRRREGLTDLEPYRAVLERVKKRSEREP